MTDEKDKTEDMDDLKDYIKRNRKSGLWIFGAFLTFLMISVVGFAAVNFVRGMAVVGQQELSPVALNDKYEWFKNVYASMDAKKASIDVFDDEAQSLVELYGDNASEWPRDVRQDATQSRTEVRGMKASYNRLAAEYNAEMSKWHTRFVNMGRLPEGGGGEIPRNVANYEYQ